MDLEQRLDLPTESEVLALPVPGRWRRVGLHGPKIMVWWIFRCARTILVFLGGVGLIAAGAVMLVLPGPGLVTIIAGLAVLATEFTWAERALDAAKARAARVAGSARDMATRRRRGAGGVAPHIAEVDSAQVRR